MVSHIATVTLAASDASIALLVQIALFVFFTDTATTEIYTLSLHDALPIWHPVRLRGDPAGGAPAHGPRTPRGHRPDRKSTRLNSSHQIISYAVFCLKKKKSHGRTAAGTRSCLRKDSGSCVVAQRGRTFTHG